jgi:hypothetical protein
MGLLLDACQAMVGCVEQQSREATCPSCGRVLEPWGACAGCGERPISSISWEA